MRKKTLSLLAAAALAVGVIGPVNAKPAEVWEDETGDADAGQGTGSIPGGFDLTGGTIEKKGADLIFTVTQADMPPTGTLPEGFRFLWAFNIGERGFRWTFKTADIGKPDVVGGQTSERVGRVDPQGHFRLEADCGVVALPNFNAINCTPVGYYTGEIDPAAATFRMIVPLKDLKAKAGTKITPGAGDNTQICQICWVSHVAERSLDSSIIDTAVMTKAYKVPKK